MTEVKICGLSTPETVDAAVTAGARFLGFVFYPSSPRYIEPARAAELTGSVPEEVRTVGLFVDPTDEEVENALHETPLDMLQLHGSETPQRLRELRHRFSLPLIKAIRVGAEEDLDSVHDYLPHCDWLLFDAKPEGAKMPGGTGQVFDWTLMQNRSIEKPWMISGGLNAENVKEALSLLHPRAVDVSSGVESTPGVKDVQKIKDFINTVKTIG